MKRLLPLLALVGVLALTVAGPTKAAPTDDATEAAAGPEGLISAEFDAFALRVEYDIPLPAGTGTVPRVVGEVRRSGAGENAKGLSAAPTQLDAVVGGTYADPDKSKKGDERRPPQVECFYPGDLVNTRFDFPTDSQAETAGLPAAGYAIAQCAAGPAVALGARNGAVDLPGLRVGGGVADGGAHPASGQLLSVASARASDVQLADGAITIASVDVHGASATLGTPGTAKTESHVGLGDVTIAGVRFSLANDQVTLAGTTVPLDAASTATLVTTLNGALSATGCRIDLLSRPEAYPQGFILGRKPPAIGVKPDGSLAASMQGGLLVLCDLPQDATAPTGFSPQRMQVLVGFAYTSVAANDEPGGFGLGGLLGGDFTSDGGTTLGGFDADEPSSGTSLASVTTGPLAPLADATAVGAVEPAPAPSAPAATAAPPPRRVAPRILPVSFAMDPTRRAVLALVCLAGWALLTHLGLRRLRGVTAS